MAAWAVGVGVDLLPLMLLLILVVAAMEEAARAEASRCETAHAESAAHGTTVEEPRRLQLAAGD